MVRQAILGNPSYSAFGTFRDGWLKALFLAQVFVPVCGYKIRSPMNSLPLRTGCGHHRRYRNITNMRPSRFIGLQTV